MKRACNEFIFQLLNNDFDMTLIPQKLCKAQKSQDQ